MKAVHHQGLNLDSLQSPNIHCAHKTQGRIWQKSWKLQQFISYTQRDLAAQINILGVVY